MKFKHIHFVGLGGMGVSALAKFAYDMGCDISGSDDSHLDFVGKDFYVGVRDTLPDGTDAVAYSSAIPSDHPELAAARRLGVPTLERQRLLGMVADRFASVTAIAGTHGKTTTTAMLAHILRAQGTSFAAMIGGDSVEFGNYVNNIYVAPSAGEQGTGCADGDKLPAAFVVEACEYKRNFLYLSPDVGVVTSVECDHPDCYKDIDDVKDAFCLFLARSRRKVLPTALLSLAGIEPFWADRYALAEVVDGEIAHTYSLDGNIIVVDGAPIGRADIGDECAYNLHNALCAVAAACAMGVPASRAVNALAGFEGVRRRFEKIGNVYFDFAHHPTEIACVLERARKFGRALVVFQPHTYSRTKAYLDDFVNVLGSPNSGIGTLILLPTYAAREVPSDGVDSRDLQCAIFDKYRKTDVYLMQNDASTADFVKSCAKKHDITLFVGAGDIYDMKRYFQNEK